MAFDNTKLSYFHSFSKTPVQGSTSLGNAINKSGHTVTTSEVWAQDIPYYGKMGSLVDVKAKVEPYARKNDMCYITAGADKGKTFQYDGAGNWTDITSTLIDGALIKNSKDEVVLLYHKGQNLTNLTADNNANTDSANNAARLWASRAKDGSALPVGESRLIEQFLAPTDKALNGLASVAYAPVIANGSLVSGTNYYDYCFSGTILWATTRTTVTPIDCFEYVGEKLDSSVTSLNEQIKENTVAIETLNGADTVSGSIAETVKNAIDALGDIAVKSDITITDIKVQNGNEQAVSLTPNKDKSVTITIPEVQNATTTKPGIVIISDNNAIETSESDSDYTATVGAIAATRLVIEEKITDIDNKLETFASATDLEEHSGDSSIHIMGDERTKWNDTSDTVDEIEDAIKGVTHYKGILNSSNEIIASNLQRGDIFYFPDENRFYLWDNYAKNITGVAHDEFEDRFTDSLNNHLQNGVLDDYLSTYTADNGIVATYERHGSVKLATTLDDSGETSVPTASTVKNAIGNIPEDAGANNIVDYINERIAENALAAGDGIDINEYNEICVLKASDRDHGVVKLATDINDMGTTSVATMSQVLDAIAHAAPVSTVENTTPIPTLTTETPNIIISEPGTTNLIFNLNGAKPVVVETKVTTSGLSLGAAGTSDENESTIIIPLVVETLPEQETKGYICMDVYYINDEDSGKIVKVYPYTIRNN